jgi:hypothetical protein
VQRARAPGLRVAAHVATAFDFRTAVAAGVAEIAHLPLERLTPADARAAAEAGVVVVTTALSHRPVDDPASLPATLAHNLELLSDAGVRLVLGTDSDRGLIDELLEVQSLTDWPAARLLDLATAETPRWIFPSRRLGALEPGSEASFLALAEDPLEDLDRLRRLSLRVKGGHVLEVAEPATRPGVANILAHALMRDGAEAAIALYRRLRREEPDAYDFSEPQLNDIGYFALQQERPAAAVAIFRLNAELFPASANVWDSLGDGLVAAGDFAGAVESYRQALAIAPHSEHTRSKLADAEAKTEDVDR